MNCNHSLAHHSSERTIVPISIYFNMKFFPKISIDNSEGKVTDASDNPPADFVETNSNFRGKINDAITNWAT